MRIGRAVRIMFGRRVHFQCWLGILSVVGLFLLFALVARERFFEPRVDGSASLDLGGG